MLKMAILPKKLTFYKINEIVYKKNEKVFMLLLTMIFISGKIKWKSAIGKPCHNMSERLLKLHFVL